MPAGYDYTVHEHTLDGPVIGNYHYEGSNDLTGPKHGDIIELEGLVGHWRVTAKHPLATHDQAAEPQDAGQLVVERVDDKLIEPHGD